MQQNKTPKLDRWSSVIARDKNQDGLFVFAVKTTGIYCRPSCPSRRPNRENVRFFDLNHQAEAAGFRACKRCKPTEISLEQVNVRRVEEACRLIEQSNKAPDLERLAQHVGLSKFHFHRLFKAGTGLTPKQYAKARQDMALREYLPGSSSVISAIYASGFDSAGRFYDRAASVLGMSPNAYRKGGKNETMWYAFADSNLGRIALAGTENGISAIRIGDDDESLFQELTSMFTRAQFVQANESLGDTVARVVRFLDTPDSLFDLPLDIQSTVFQKRVWDALQKLPAGETVSYADLARQVGEPRAFRAVANACGANPVLVAIPCHRVVRSDGGLGGYCSGPEIKKKLLDREAAAK